MIFAEIVRVRFRKMLLRKERVFELLQNQSYLVNVSLKCLVFVRKKHFLISMGFQVKQLRQDTRILEVLFSCKSAVLP